MELCGPAIWLGVSGHSCSWSWSDKACAVPFLLCVPLRGTSSQGPGPLGRAVPLVRMQEGRRAWGRGRGKGEGSGRGGARGREGAWLAWLQLSSPSCTWRAVYFHSIRCSVIKLTASTLGYQMPQSTLHSHWTHSPFFQPSGPPCPSKHLRRFQIWDLKGLCQNKGISPRTPPQSTSSLPQALFLGFQFLMKISTPACEFCQQFRCSSPSWLRA